MLVDSVAKMRQISASESAVPVSAVTLAAIQLSPRLIEQRSFLMVAIATITVAIQTGFALSARRTQLMQPATHHLHAGIHLIRFGILYFEVPPVSASYKGSNFLPLPLMFPLVLAMDEFLETLGRQRPLGHFAIAGFRDIDLAKWRQLLERL